MVKKFTLFELHLDDARFSNAVAGTPEDAEALLGEMDEEMAESDEPAEESSGRSLGSRLLMAAFAVVVAVGVRTIARRLLSEDEMGEELIDEEYDEGSISVDLDESIEA